MTDTRRKAIDFKFLRIIGEGSFSTVFLAQEVKTRREFAIKVCEKKQISREKKSYAIMREKQILKILSDNYSPYFITLCNTFQDDERLYFVMNYAKRGELLTLINKKEFDESSARFYCGEILLALEHLHKLGIVHRDLKPENILLTESLHIQVTDFGSALILNSDNPEVTSNVNHSLKTESQSEIHAKRRNSFVGTAHYVSPEMLTSKKASPSSDLWAFGCILYQMLSKSVPFRAANEYLIFQKILNLDYDFDDGFNDAAQQLIKDILQVDPSDRLGVDDDLKSVGYVSIKNHPFFAHLDSNWDLISRIPPIAAHFSESYEDLANNCITHENFEPGLEDWQMTRLMGLALHEDYDRSKKGILDITPIEMQERLSIQKRENKFHRFVENNVILKQGLIDKKKGLFARRRMFILTTGPHLYYIDESNMVLKGQVPWSKDMRAEAKNFRIFYIHTPNRIYDLNDISGNAPEWCRIIEEVRKKSFDTNSHNINRNSNLTNTTVPIAI